MPSKKPPSAKPIMIHAPRGAPAAAFSGMGWIPLRAFRVASQSASPAKGSRLSGGQGHGAPRLPDPQNGAEHAAIVTRGKAGAAPEDAAEEGVIAIADGLGDLVHRQVASFQQAFCRLDAQFCVYSISVVPVAALK